MSFLVSNFREKVSKLKTYDMKLEYEQDVSYSTGFLPLDFANASMMRGYNPETKQYYNYISAGITSGSIATFIGRSTSGKTTQAVQIASNIIRPFPEGAIIHEDSEGGLSEARKKILTRMIDEELELKYVHRNTRITLENFYERVKMFFDLKMENREKLLYDTGHYDIRGNKIYKLQPTVIILDSLMLLLPEKLTEEEELSGQMAATSTAKAIAAMLKRILPMLKSANIIIFIINHINELVNINPRQIKRTQLPYLKQNETLPGGNAPIYLANFMVRLDDHTKLVEGKDFNINGTLVNDTFIKTRSGVTGKFVTLVFDYARGFDEDLTLLQFMKDQDMIKGAGAYLYINERSDMKFAQKHFKEKLNTIPEFRQMVLEEVLPVFKSMVPPYIDKFDSNSSFTNELLANL